jgi:hypothetical protein
VTFGGAAAPGIGLELVLYDFVSGFPVASTTTDALGRYHFTSVPSLETGEAYRVHFDNTAVDARYVSYWYGPEITSYTAGQAVDGGEFDIANVVLLAPDTDDWVSLPAEFRWGRRELPRDGYRWYLFDLDDPSTFWWTDDLGDVGSYTLTGLPWGAVYGKVYGWYVLVYSGADSYGSSCYYRRVTFW